MIIYKKKCKLFFFTYHFIFIILLLTLFNSNYEFNNRIIYDTLVCLKSRKCKQKCLKMKNTRTIQMNYKINDYPNPFPFNYFFIHNSTCPSNTYLFMYIISECKQIAERNSVRQTWGMERKHISIRYIIGIGGSDCYNNYKIENRKYGDILQINIQESFANETLFNLYTMKYLTILCPYASYFAKFDVDTYVDLNKLLKDIIPYKNQEFKFWGAEKQKWKKVNADQSFKYSSPVDVANYYNNLFPIKGIDVYSGFASVFSSDIPSLIFNFSYNYPILMRIDDQYISWLLYKLKIKISSISSYAILPNRCRIYKNVTVIHRITSLDLISFSRYIKGI